MKATRYFSVFVAAAALCGAAWESSAQLTQSYTNTFDTASSVASWDYMWYVVTSAPMVWDSTMDAASSANSGSLKLSIPWLNGGGQQLWGGTWGNTSQSDNALQMNGACFTSISCDIHVDPSSAVSSKGNYGPLELGFLTQYGMTYPNNSTVTLPLSATNGWTHFSVPVAGFTATGLRGLGMQMNEYSGTFNGASLFWLDNLKCTATPNYTNSFDVSPYSGNTASSTISWIYAQGVNSANSSMSWDSATDANGSSSSGSLKVSIPWKNGNSSGANLSQTMFGTFANRSNFDNGETTSGFNFQDLLCSVHVDPSSPKNAAGNYGVLQVGFVADVNGAWSGVTWPSGAVTLNANASSGWTNLVVPIDYTAPGLSNVSGIFLEMQTGAAQGGGLPGTTLLWVDDIGTVAAGAPAGPTFTSASQSGSTVIINGVNPNCPAGMDCVILSSTDLTLAMSHWTPIATNAFNANGTFSFTNVVNPSQPATYFSFVPNIAVTVQASQPGCSFTVDGKSFTAAQTFSWTPGSSHVIATTSPQSGGTGIQRLWSNWSDGGAMSHVVSPTAGAIYTATFTTQYYLTMNASAGGGVSPGSGWNNSGAVVAIGTTENGGYYFSGWTGSGSGSYSGSSSSASVTMNGPITETASFTTNISYISVTAQANPADSSFTVDGTEYTTNETFSWISGSSHVIATTSAQSGGVGIQYLWSSWSDGGAMSHSVTPTIGTTYTANFTTQYYLTMSAGTGGGASPASGWENSGAVIPISAPANSGYAFSSWTGSGSGSYSGASSSMSVTMNGPISETASFTVIPLAPVPSFAMSTNMGVAPFTVTFTDTSTRNPTSWLWTFGDGGTSTLQNPSYTFTNMWRQTVTLTASNAGGAASSRQAVYQCFPCDAVYDWTNGIQGHPATIATLSNSLVGGSSQIGYFTMTNFDLPSANVQGIIFTNLPGMTNGCPVVFPSGVVYSNFQTTNALAYCYTNQHEQYDFHFNANLAVTNIVLMFYDSLPLCTNVWEYCIDELNISTTRTYPDLGLFCLNRDLGLSPLPDGMNDCHTSETCVPTIYGQCPFPSMTNMDFNGSQIYARPNKLYRILMEENTNSQTILAIADPATSTLCGFVTNFNLYEMGHLITAYANGHTSFEVMTNNGYDQASWTNLTSILAAHSIISINRPLSWYQASNAVMFGP